MAGPVEPVLLKSMRVRGGEVRSSAGVSFSVLDTLLASMVRRMSATQPSPAARAQWKKTSPPLHDRNNSMTQHQIAPETEARGDLSSLTVAASPTRPSVNLANLDVASPTLARERAKTLSSPTAAGGDAEAADSPRRPDLSRQASENEPHPLHFSLADVRAFLGAKG